MYLDRLGNWNAPKGQSLEDSRLSYAPSKIAAGVLAALAAIGVTNEANATDLTDDEFAAAVESISVVSVGEPVPFSGYRDISTQEHPDHPGELTISYKTATEGLLYAPFDDIRTGTFTPQLYPADSTGFPSGNFRAITYWGGPQVAIGNNGRLDIMIDGVFVEATGAVRCDNIVPIEIGGEEHIIYYNNFGDLVTLSAAEVAAWRPGSGSIESTVIAENIVDPVRGDGKVFAMEGGFFVGTHMPGSPIVRFVNPATGTEIPLDPLRLQGMFPGIEGRGAVSAAISRSELHNNPGQDNGILVEISDPDGDGDTSDAIIYTVELSISSGPTSFDTTLEFGPAPSGTEFIISGCEIDPIISEAVSVTIEGIRDTCTELLVSIDAPAGINAFPSEIVAPVTPGGVTVVPIDFTTEFYAEITLEAFNDLAPLDASGDGIYRSTEDMLTDGATVEVDVEGVTVVLTQIASGLYVGDLIVTRPFDAGSIDGTVFVNGINRGTYIIGTGENNLEIAIPTEIRPNLSLSVDPDTIGDFVGDGSFFQLRLIKDGEAIEIRDVFRNRSGHFVYDIDGIEHAALTFEGLYPADRETLELLDYSIEVQTTPGNWVSLNNRAELRPGDDLATEATFPFDEHRTTLHEQSFIEDDFSIISPEALFVTVRDNEGNGEPNVGISWNNVRLGQTNILGDATINAGNVSAEGIYQPEGQLGVHLIDGTVFYSLVDLADTPSLVVDLRDDGADAGGDTGTDAGFDTGSDAGDAGTDSEPDTGGDTGTDAGFDAGSDAGDTGPDTDDTGIDAGTPDTADAGDSAFVEVADAGGDDAISTTDAIDDGAGDGSSNNGKNGGGCATAEGPAPSGPMAFFIGLAAVFNRRRRK